MRFIDLEEIRPRIRDEIRALEDATRLVLEAHNADERRALFQRFRNRWTALREELSAHSHNKCWYIECKNPGTDDDIDHFRPKAAVKEEPDHPGYYWLAFEWTNLRLSCHHANRPRTNAETGETGGKSDHFPLIDPAMRAWEPTDDVRREEPALLDPTRLADVAMLSFAPNGDAELAPRYRGLPVPEAKFCASRKYLNLNWPKFRDSRVILYNQIERIVHRGQREAPTDYTDMHSAADSFVDACRDLIRTMKAEEEYSMAARAYVESFKHFWWVQEIVLPSVVR